MAVRPVTRARTPKDARSRRTTYRVRSVVRGLSILAALADGPRRLTELAKVLRVDKATLFRYCATLSDLKYVDLDPATKAYALGPMSRSLGFAAISGSDVHAALRTWLKPLAERFQGSSAFGILDRLEAVYLDRAVAEGALIYAMSPGARLPATRSSMGKMLLAEVPASERSRLLSKAKLDVRTRAKLAHELERAAKDGYALNVGGFREGLNAAAVLVEDARTRRTAGALMVASYRMSEDDLVRKVVPVLRDTAERAGRGEAFSHWS